MEASRWMTLGCPGIYIYIYDLFIYTYIYLYIHIYVFIVVCKYIYILYSLVASPQIRGAPQGRALSPSACSLPRVSARALLRCCPMAMLPLAPLPRWCHDGWPSDVPPHRHVFVPRMWHEKEARANNKTNAINNTINNKVESQLKKHLGEAEFKNMLNGKTSKFCIVGLPIQNKI